jgi:hypothetical protein
MLTDDEIRRRLREIRFSPVADRYARRAPSMNGIAKAAGVARENLHRIVNGATIWPGQREKLSRFFSCDPLTGERSRGR